MKVREGDKKWAMLGLSAWYLKKGQKIILSQMNSPGKARKMGPPPPL
jgi:hypothetical protein